MIWTHIPMIQSSAGQFLATPCGLQLLDHLLLPYLADSSQEKVRTDSPDRTYVWQVDTKGGGIALMVSCACLPG